MSISSIKFEDEDVKLLADANNNVKDLKQKLGELEIVIAVHNEQKNNLVKSAVQAITNLKSTVDKIKEKYDLNSGKWAFNPETNSFEKNEEQEGSN